MKACLDILTASTNAPKDLRTFVTAQLAFWLLAAIDGHAKNFSIALLSQYRFRLTPFYDVLLAWPKLEKDRGSCHFELSRCGVAIHQQRRARATAAVPAGPRAFETAAPSNVIPITVFCRALAYDQLPHTFGGKLVTC